MVKKYLLSLSKGEQRLRDELLERFRERGLLKERGTHRPTRLTDRLRRAT